MKIYTAQEEIDIALIDACNVGDFKTIKYLLTEHTHITPSVNAKMGTPLSYSCARGFMDIVQYLLTSPELKEHADILIGDPLDYAIRYQKLDIIKYLVEYPNTKNKKILNSSYIPRALKTDNFSIIQYIYTSNLFAEQRETINKFIMVICHQNERMDILQYLILHNHIQKTQGLIEYLLNRPDINAIFTQKKFKEDLMKHCNSTPNKNISISKVKL